MLRRLLRLVTAACILAFAQSAMGIAGNSIKMSTTTSTEDSGLLDVILPHFTKETGIEVRVTAKGTGAAMRDGIDGNVDVILVHDREREEKFISEGYGSYRLAVMHNDFVILGPPADPAGIKGIKDAVSSLRLVAKKQATFVSRGDESGTHSKELALWKLTGVPMKRSKIEVTVMGGKKEIHFESPDGQWYFSIGQGMGATLLLADEKKAYTISDRATFLRQKFGKTPGTDLEVLCEGDDRLFNYYGVIPIHPKKHPHVNFQQADVFAKWLVSPRGQSLIEGFKISGKQAFFPDAVSGNR